MPTPASERQRLREQNAFQYPQQASQEHKEIDYEALYFERVKNMTPLERWEDAHDWTLSVGDDLEICDKTDWDVYSCRCVKIENQDIWIQRDDRSFLEIAELALLQPVSDEDDDEY